MKLDSVLNIEAIPHSNGHGHGSLEKERMMFALSLCSEGIIWLNERREVTFINIAAEDMFSAGPGELIGSKLDLPLESKKGELTLLHPSRGLLTAEFSAAESPEMLGRGWFVFLSDVTVARRDDEERLQAEERERQTERLSSLASFAGGLAHQFNNLLMVILGNAESVRNRLSDGSPALDGVNSIERAARQAVEITSHMSLFSGTGPIQLQRFNLSDLIERMKPLINASSRHALVEFNLQSDLPDIEADAAQLRQSVVLLVSRAVANMHDRQGYIGVTTGVQFCQDGSFQTGQNFTSGPGEFVYLQVSDTGRALSEKDQRLLFEPFAGQHQSEKGLGIAAVLGCVRAHLGAVEVLSAPGSGTSIELFFPVAPEPVVRAEEKSKERDWRGVGTILVVDDEEEVRMLLGEMCREIGFEVLRAKDGAESVKVFAEHADEISLVLLDYMMPNMEGDEVARRLRKIRKDVKIIISSGFFAPVLMQGLKSQGLDEFLQKPFTLPELISKVKGVMS